MRERWWLVAAAFVICMGMTVLPAGAQLPVTTPTVSTPTVPTPTVPVPTVPTPTVPTPTPVPTPKPPPAPAPAPVRVPSVTVPSVTTPSVSTPAGTVQSTSTPSVRTPSVSTPSAPSVSTPSVSTPGSAGARSGGGSTGSGASGSSGSSGPAGGSGSSAPATTGTAGSTPGSATSPGGATGADGQAQRGGSSSAKPKTRAGRVRQRERDLRRTVLRFHGCLSRVPRSERRVLSLRAGVGRLRPHTRSEVARITHLRRARVIKLERRGLRRLRALNRAGACQDAGAPTTAVTAAPGTGTSVPPSGGSGQRGGVLAEHHSSAASRDSGSQRKPEQAELSISRPSTGGPGGGSFDLALVLGPLAFLAFLLVITREVRRTG
jgi:hypothetical protein